MSKENFSALRFLLENYQNSKFDSLRSGLDYMKRNIGSKTMNSTDNLLKTNISSFMDAIKIMKDIHWLSSNDKKNEFTRVFEFRLKGTFFYYLFIKKIILSFINLLIDSYYKYYLLIDSNKHK